MNAFHDDFVTVTSSVFCDITLYLDLRAPAAVRNQCQLRFASEIAVFGRSFTELYALNRIKKAKGRRFPSQCFSPRDESKPSETPSLTREAITYIRGLTQQYDGQRNNWLDKEGPDQKCNSHPSPIRCLQGRHQDLLGAAGKHVRLSRTGA
jgi:hypothetical protein